MCYIVVASAILSERSMAELAEYREFAGACRHWAIQ